MPKQLQVPVETTTNPYARAKEEKRNGRKVIGITPMYFPEELVHAAGALPVILQESTEPVTVGGQLVFPNFCGFSRSNVDWGMKGELNFFDAIVISDVCLETRLTFDILTVQVKVPFIYHWWPLDYDHDRWHKSTRERLEESKAKIEEITGTKITDGALRQSIKLYNRGRELLRAIYGVRLQNPGVLRARQMQDLVLAGMLMPKEEHVELLEKVLAEVQAAGPAGNGQPKIFLSGHLCYRITPDILNLVEDLGAAVVGDDLYAGYRSYAAETRTDIDPMDALVERYFSNGGVPCPSKSGAQGDWATYVLQQVKETGAHGVVSMMPKYCEPQMFYHPDMRNNISNANVPYVFLETEHEAVSIEGTRTRLEAFIETLRMRAES